MNLTPTGNLNYSFVSSLLVRRESNAHADYVTRLLCSEKYFFAVAMETPFGISSIAKVFGYFLESARIGASLARRFLFSRLVGCTCAN